MAIITTRFGAGRSLTHNEVDANFNNLNAELAIVYMPGEIRRYAGMTIPAGWIECVGQLMEIADYPELYAAIGTLYGGDGVTSFALPSYVSVTGVRSIICSGSALVKPFLQVEIPCSIHGPVSGIYHAGADMEFYVQLIAPVVLSGSPLLTVLIGGITHTVALVSSTNLTWVFSAYEVQPGNVGDVSVSIDLNSATLTSAADGSPVVLEVVYTPSGISVGLAGDTHAVASSAGTSDVIVGMSGSAQGVSNTTGTLDQVVGLSGNAQSSSDSSGLLS